MLVVAGTATVLFGAVHTQSVGAEGDAPVSEPTTSMPVGDRIGPTVTIEYRSWKTGQRITQPPSLWFNETIGIIVHCEDPDGVFRCDSPNPPNGWQAGLRYTNSVTDIYGAETYLDFIVPVDTGPPTISVSNDGQTFTRDQTVTLNCTVSDDRSGVAWVDNPCPVNVPASNFAPGTYYYLVRARDGAGNESSRVASFTRAPQVVRVCDPDRRVKQGRRWVTIPGTCRDVVK